MAKKKKDLVDLVEQAADSAYELAEKLIEFDEVNPGEPESEVVVPYAVWEHWIDLAGKAGQLRGER